MFKQAIRAILAAVGLNIVRINQNHNSVIGKVGFLKHQGEKKGNALISYIVEPFLLQDES